MNDDKLRKAENFTDVFGGLSYYEMDANRSMYNFDKKHFNDKGHNEYDAFVDSLLKAERSSKL